MAYSISKMSIPTFQVKGSSIASVRQMPLSARLADPRNYKAEVLKELEARAFGRPVCELAFKDLPVAADEFIINMCKTYELTIYYCPKL